MAALLALISSITWGSADFLGGIAARRVGALRVLTVSYPAGVVVLIPIAIWLLPGQLSGDVALWAIAGGAVGAVAMVLLYGALARGPMGIVSPLTAVMSAAIPVAVGLALGESLGWIAFVGMALAAVAVILVSRERGEHLRASPLALGLALGSGVAIGLYLTVLGLAPADSGIWTATIARAVSSALVVGVALVWLRPRTVTHFPWLLALVAGSLDALANGVFQLAAQRGDLAVVAVIGSLYPAATVILARLILKERMSGIQATGVALALAAAAALSLG
jgi:drug/metabolite transporter (DMT)-like permease